METLPSTTSDFSCYMYTSKCGCVCAKQVLKSMYTVLYYVAMLLALRAFHINYGFHLTAVPSKM